MRWDDERYVRVYTRDTTDWVAMTWEARAVFIFLLRAADRAGIIPLGKRGLKGLAQMLHMPVDVLERAVMELGEDGCITSDGSRIVIPNFMDAQEVPISDAQRKRDQRERARLKAMEDTKPGHTESRAVTSGHEESRGVTPNRAVPSLPNRAVPDVTDEEARGFYAWAQKQRAERLRALEQFPIPSDLPGWYRKASESARGDAALRQAWLGYLEDPWAKGLKPACPWAAWTKDLKWTGYLPTGPTRPKSMRPMKPGETEADYEAALGEWKKGQVSHG